MRLLLNRQPLFQRFYWSTNKYADFQKQTTTKNTERNILFEMLSLYPIFSMDFIKPQTLNVWTKNEKNIRTTLKRQQFYNCIIFTHICCKATQSLGATVKLTKESSVKLIAPWNDLNLARSRLNLFGKVNCTLVTYCALIRLQQSTITWFTSDPLL